MALDNYLEPLADELALHAQPGIVIPVESMVV